MNREFLKNLGIADDLINKIMGEHGKDVQAEKDKAKTASGELETYKAKVSELEKAAEGNADLKKQLDDLKAQVEKEKKVTHRIFIGRNYIEISIIVMLPATIMKSPFIAVLHTI